MANKYDFCGYATKNDIRCADGRTIRRNAFKDCDGKTVPLVWQHLRDNPENIIGHALLENRDDGVYAYGTFNDTKLGRHSKTLVEHGDITAMSIYANKLQQSGGDVLHGLIREVSLVVAGANPGALIDYPILSHGEESEDEAIIYTDDEFSIDHSFEDDTTEGSEEESVDDELEQADKDPESTDQKEEKTMAGSERTLKDIFDSLNDEQKQMVYALVGLASEEAAGEGEEMKQNLFDSYEQDETEYLSHADMEAIINDAKRCGSVKQAALEHGIENVGYLFPDAQTINNQPDFIKRDTGWVSDFMSKTKHTPFSRVKSIHADITADEARARGYVKGNMKVEEVFALLKRVTNPCTIYKKQKMDRDDVIDITDFDVIAFLKGEMRGMLDEEIARAALVSDGRINGTDDKISEDSIRPIWTDNDLYTIKTTIPVGASMTADQKAKAFIRAAVKSRKNYKGSGNPILFTTEDMLTDMLLIEDKNERVIYDTEAKLATALRVSKIVTVPVMEGLSREVSGVDHDLAGIIVNPVDYNFGADKGGSVNMFDDFDIDYNAMKYLIETRCSGALIKPYSAIALEFVAANA